MIGSLLLQLIWVGVYLQSPYLFSGIASILYFCNFDADLPLDLLVAFPMGFYHIVQDLRAGRKPRYPGTITLELIRWLIVLTTGGCRPAMVEYSYGLLVHVGSDWLGLPEVKHLWYLLWLRQIVDTDWTCFVLYVLNFATLFYH